jgi:hypothetical protein
MRIGLLLPANVYFCPYVKIYTRILDLNNISYHILYWDRDGIEEPAAYRFHKLSPQNAGLGKKLFDYYLYARFLKKKLKREKYSYLIIFGSQIAIFLYPYLRRHYNQKFIFDYRDLSIEQRLKTLFKKLLRLSKLNVISSPGFRNCLPDEFSYVLSHNFDIDLLQQSISKEISLNGLYMINNQFVILTIGGIRDYEQNAAIIKSFANNSDYQIHFIGKGVSSESLKHYAEINNVQNVHFEGFYEKTYESEYLKRCTLMNIYYPRKLSHDTALSNRFYNSLIYCKPMITTADTIQGNYAVRYHVGVAITSEDIASEIQHYINNFDPVTYKTGRYKLLKEFYMDYEIFERSLLKALYNK